MTLRCHSCSHGLGEVDYPVRLVALYRTSFLEDGEKPPAPGEVRRLCRSCKWINVFRAVRAYRVVELKAAR